MFNGSRFLWHHVPPAMKGNHLWPLRELEIIAPEIAAKNREKYVGREHIAQLHVPLLDCSWDEVIFLSPIHPYEISAALQTVGFPLRPGHVYQIEADTLKGREAIWLDPTKTGPDRMLTPESVATLDMDEYLSVPLSDKAVPYYQRCAEQGHRPLFLATEKHVLVRGYTRDKKPYPIDVSKAVVITKNVPMAGSAP